MDEQKYIIWSTYQDTSASGIACFCEHNAGRYGKTVDEMKALPLGRIMGMLWNDTCSWRIAATEALRDPTDGPILVIADKAGDGPLSKPHVSCIVLSGDRLNNIFDLRQEHSSTFYSDGSNIRCTNLTSTGADHYLFREITNLKGLNAFVQRINAGEAFTESELDLYSRSLAPTVHKIFGWPEPGRRPLEAVLAEASSRVQTDKGNKTIEVEHSH